MRDTEERLSRLLQGLDLHISQNLPCQKEAFGNMIILKTSAGPLGSQANESKEKALHLD